MPSRIYHRFWCSSCNDFTLHGHGVDSACHDCGTVTKEYNLSEVPLDKLLAQRERYKRKRRESVLNMFNAPIGLFDRTHSYEIIETDAGQKEIDDVREKQLKKLREERDALVEEYNLFYRNTGRNDACPCGKVDNNGKPLKYKKCCLTRFNLIL